MTGVLLVVAAQPAAAAFPGSNGRIAMQQAAPFGVTTIATVNADGTGRQEGVVSLGPTNRAASWSPDGRRLAFSSDRDGNAELYLLDVDTGNQTRLTFDAAEDRDPAWSPDGTRLAFSSDRDGDLDVYVMPVVQDGVPLRLADDPAIDRQPAWSVTGAIAFVSDRTAGDFDIHVVDEQGGGLRRLTQEPGLDADPSWSPDGARLAYTHAPSIFARDVFVVGADGSGRRPLVETPGIEQFPAWSPDGTRIAFAGDGAVLVMPATPGATAFRVGSGTDPNWAPVPPPVGGPDVGQTITMAPLAGQVLFAPATEQPPATQPGLQAQLRTAGEVPVGTNINASQGTVALEAVTTTPDGPGTVGRAEVRGGVFSVGQVGSGEPTLRMLGRRPCQPARISAVPPEFRMRIRARGRFRTIGGYGRASGRGTEWAMRERCRGTLFKVIEGVVLVHDYRRRGSFQLRAGQCYLAAARPRRDTLRPRRTCPGVRPTR